MDKSDRGMLMGTIPPERNPSGKKIILAGLGIYTIILPFLLYWIVSSFLEFPDPLVLYFMPLMFFFFGAFSYILLRNIFSRYTAPVDIFMSGLLTPRGSPLRLRVRVFIPRGEIAVIKLIRSNTVQNWSGLGIKRSDGGEEYLVFRQTDILTNGAAMISRTYGIGIDQEVMKNP